MTAGRADDGTTTPKAAVVSMLATSRDKTRIAIAEVVRERDIMVILYDVSGVVRCRSSTTVVMPGY